MSYFFFAQFSEEDLLKNPKAFNTKRTTSHWPHKIWLFSRKPQTYGRPILDITPLNEDFKLTEIGMKLAGF